MARLTVRLRLELALIADRIANRLRPAPEPVDLEARLAAYGPVRHLADLEGEALAVDLRRRLELVREEA